MEIVPKVVDLKKLCYKCQSLVKIGQNHAELLLAAHTSFPTDGRSAGLDEGALGMLIVVFCQPWTVDSKPYMFTFLRCMRAAGAAQH